MHLTPELVHSFARANSHLQWRTDAQEKPFTFEVGETHITFRISTNNERSVSMIELQRICETYNATQSLRPVDYQNITHHSSYVLAIFRELLTSIEKQPFVSADLATPDPERVHTWINRIVRDTKIAMLVKILHEYICQICASTIELPNGTRYAEAHHIRPLGGEHKGKDVIENIICVCPNCHAKCDLLAISLDPDSLRCVDGHNVSLDSILYHNTKVIAHKSEFGSTKD